MCISRSSGKKCTYGIKCKFYHPERANQSQRSLADELRENARLADSRGTGTPRDVQKRYDAGFGSCSTSLEQELEEKLNLESEYGLQRNDRYWDAIFSAQKKPLPPAASAASDRAGLQTPFPTNPSSVFSSDSGLGSYVSQFSESCHSLEEQHKMRPNHPSISSSSNPILPAGGPHCGDNRRSYSCNYQAGCSAYGSVPVSGPLQHYSLPAYIQQSGWPYPFYIPQMHANSLPEPFPCPNVHSSPDSYGRQRSSVVKPQKEREEVRRKLYAIFNPRHVDRVMDMFPQLIDPQQLAAEVLKLKSNGEFF